MAFVRQHALVVYFVLAYAISWTLVLLVPVMFLFALLALWGPALAAILVTAALSGRAGIGALFRRLRIWRVGVAPYAVAIGVPFIVAVAAQVANALMFGGRIGVVADAASIPLMIVLALLVLGEEIGWRGFALPHLLERFNGLVSSVILGALWAAWHLINATLAGLEAYWYGFPAFLFFVVSQTVLFTWLWNRTGGSLLLVWILHAMVNVSGGLFFVGTQVAQWWLAGAGYALVAVILLIAYGPALVRAESQRVSAAVT